MSPFQRSFADNLLVRFVMVQEVGVFAFLSLKSNNNDVAKLLL